MRRRGNSRSTANDIRLGEHLLLVGEQNSTTCYTEDKLFRFTFKFDFKRGCWVGSLARALSSPGGEDPYQKCADFFIPNNDQPRLHAILLKKLADREYAPALVTQRIRKLRALID